VVGAGYFSRFHFDAWVRCPQVELVGIADRDHASAERLASTHKVEWYDCAETMLDAQKPHILDIVTPPHTHLDLISLAADRGVNIVCQKPFCGTLDAAQQAVDLALAANVELIVHENFRFQPWYRAAKGKLENGELGKIYQITMRLRPGDGQGADAYLDRQPYFQKMERFLIHETALHLVDVARYLMGEVDNVWADLRQLNPAISGEDAGIVVMGFRNGARGIVDGNRLSDHVAQDRRRTMGEMLIEGANGILELNGDGELLFRRTGQNDIQRVSFEWSDRGFAGDCVYNFISHVVDHHIQGLPLENRGIDYLANLKIEEAIYASAADGKKRNLF